MHPSDPEVETVASLLETQRPLGRASESSTSQCASSPWMPPSAPLLPWLSLSPWVASSASSGVVCGSVSSDTICLGFSRTRAGG